MVTLRNSLPKSYYEIVQLASQGWTAAQIAFRLGCTCESVKQRLHRIHDIAGTADRLELAVRYAFERQAYLWNI